MSRLRNLCGLATTALTLSAGLTGAAVQEDVQIDLGSIQCWPTDQFLVVRPTFAPPNDVYTAKFYFRSIAHPDYYYIEIPVGPEGGGRVILPKAEPQTAGVSFYAEAVTRGYSAFRSEEKSIPVASGSECRRQDPAAAYYTGPNPNISIGATHPGPQLPFGFQPDGITQFISSTGIPGEAGGGGISGKTVALIGGGGGAAALALLAGGSKDSPPAFGGNTTVTTTAATTTTVVSGGGSSTTTTVGGGSGGGGGGSTTTTVLGGTTSIPTGSTTTVIGGSTTTTVVGGSTTTTVVGGSTTTTVVGGSTTTTVGSSTTTVPTSTTTSIGTSTTTAGSTTTTASTTTVGSSTTTAATTSVSTSTTTRASTTTTSTGAPLLGLGKRDDKDPVGPGATFNYFISISNTGGSTATGVSVSDPLPPGLQLQFISNASCRNFSGTIMCFNLTVPVGGIPDIRIQVVAPRPAGNITLTNTATLTFGATNLSATERTTVLSTLRSPDGAGERIAVKTVLDVDPYDGRSHGQVVFNEGAAVQVDNTGPVVQHVGVVPGENRVEATRVGGKGRSGFWRFDFGASRQFVPGSLQVDSGQVYALDQASIVFATNGEGVVRFRFRVQQAQP